MAENSNSTEASIAIFIDEQRLRAVVGVLLTLGIAAAVPAGYIRWHKKRLHELEYLLLLGALVFYIAYEAVLLSVMPNVYKLHLFTSGETSVWPDRGSMLGDLYNFTTLMFVSSLMLWSLLWSVKFSLLVLYRRLMIGLPHELLKWNVVFGYTAITYIYTMVTTFTSCGGPINFTREPLLFCARPGDNVTRNLSFYGAFASDVTADLLIMLLPLKLIWKLKLSTQRKIAVGGVFSIGIFIVVAAIVRLIQIDSTTGSLNPNSQWLILWGSVEATTAIIVGCLPSFRFLRKTSQPSDGAAYDYSTGNSLSANRKENRGIPLRDFSGNNSRHSHTVAIYGGGGGASSSKESLTPKNAGPVTARHLVRVFPKHKDDLSLNYMSNVTHRVI